jgi:T5SS/PEP-CTERM-associated repeat protein
VCMPRLTVPLTRRLLSLIFLTLLCSNFGFAQDTATWIGGVGFWSNPANWSCSISGKFQSCVPNGGNISTTVTAGIVTLDVNISINFFEIDSGATVIINGFSVATGQIVVGDGGTATLTINSGGQVTASSVFLGVNPGSSGTLNVSGQSQLTCSLLVVGSAGSGVLNISGGGKVNDQRGFISNGISGSSGAVTISGAGARWDNAIDVQLGLANQSTLTLLDGAGGSSGSGGLIIGLNPGASASMNLQGARTTWDDSGGVSIQDNTNNVGSLNVQDGAILTTTSALNMGQAGTLTISGGGQVSDVGGVVQGHVTVSGAGSQWSSSQTLSNFGSLLIQNGGMVTGTPQLTNNGTVTIDDRGTLSVTGSYIDQSGGLFFPSTTVSGSGALQATTVSIQAGSTLAGTGTISGSTIVGNQMLGAGLLPGLNGATPGTLTFIGGPLTIAANGELREVLTPAGFSVLSVRGDLFLGGRLSIEQFASYDPPAGTTLTIMNADAVHGQLIIGNPIFSGGNKLWTLRIDPGGTTVALVAVSRGCTFTLSPASTSFPADGGSGSVAVMASQPTCAWNATSNVPWLTVVSGASGIGDGTVTYAATDNLNSIPRQGSLSIGDQTLTVMQAGVLVSLVVDPAAVAPSFVHAPSSFRFPGSPKSLVRATATLKDTEGQLVQTPVTVDFSVQPDLDGMRSAGHCHSNLNDLARFLVLVDDNDSPTSVCKTGQDGPGQCHVLWIVDDESGVFRVDAALDANPTINASQNVAVTIGSLSSIATTVPSDACKADVGNGVGYVLVGQFGTDSVQSMHYQNHYGTPMLVKNVKDLASEYFNNRGKTLQVNDMSLPLGGLFDLDNDWLIPHSLHRDGNSVDINTHNTDGSQVDLNLLTRFARILGMCPAPEPMIHFDLEISSCLPSH